MARAVPLLCKFVTFVGCNNCWHNRQHSACQIVSLFRFSGFAFILCLAFRIIATKTVCGVGRLFTLHVRARTMHRAGGGRGLFCCVSLGVQHFVL